MSRRRKGRKSAASQRRSHGGVRETGSQSVPPPPVTAASHEPVPPAAREFVPPETDIGLSDIIQVVNRRKWIVMAIVFSITFVAAIALFRVTPLFTARTQILIEGRTANIVHFESVVAGLTGDEETIKSEAEILRSRSLGNSVVEGLALDDDPEFNSALRPPGRLARIMSSIGWQSADANSVETGALAGEAADRERVLVVDAFLNRLEVTPRKRTRVLTVKFTSEDPVKAASIVNTLADQYILSQLQSKFEATQRANDWLNERVTELREKVAAAETAVEQFRQQSGLLQGKGFTLTSQEIAELNTQLILARTARAEAEARLKQVSTLVEAQDGVNTAAEVLDSPLVQRLREQQAEVERRVAELSTELGELHPRMINLWAEASDLQQKIDDEVDKIVRGLENEVEIARAREASLSRSLEQLKARAAEANQDEVQLRALEREAEASRTLLATMLARFKETTSQEDFSVQQADARIISKADVPADPSFPQKKVVLGLVFLGSSMLAGLIVLLLELLDNGFRSGEQIEQATGASSLGFIPRLSRSVRRKKLPHDFIVEQPKSALGESIRTLHWSIGLTSPDHPPKTVLITSAVPEEGKTTIGVSLARIQALGGQKTLIIDADTRNPGVHTAFGMANTWGLVDVLTDGADLEDVLKTDEKTGARVLTAGASVPNAPDLLASERMRRLIQRLAASHDLIVIDSPPVMAATDALILSKEADTTVFVVHWAKTSRQRVRLALQRIHKAGGRLGGVLLSMVDVKKHAQYSYGDSGSYYGALDKYYGD